MDYIAIPPCLFGDESEGLYPPHYLSYDTNLTFIKWNNNTYEHYGEMDMWQMRGAQAWDPNATVGRRRVRADRGERERAQCNSSGAGAREEPTAGDACRRHSGSVLFQARGKFWRTRTRVRFILR